MAEPQDKLAARIAARKAAAEAAKQQGGVAAPAEPPTPSPSTAPVVTPAPVAPAAPVATPVAGFPSETKTARFPTETTKHGPEVFADILAALAANENSMIVARKLAALIDGGMDRKDLLDNIGKSKGWLSKKLQLLNAPKDVQRLIEAGELSESEYFDNREGVAVGIKGRGETLRFQRMSRVSIYSEAARDLAAILAHLADQLGAAPVRVADDATLKDLTNILNLRAGEVRRLLKK